MPSDPNTGLNLNPYGNAWSGGTGQLVEGSYEMAALQRAAAKYASVRRNFPPEPKVSAITPAFVAGVVVCVPLSGLFFWLMFLLASERNNPNPIALLFLGLFGMAIISLPIAMYLTSRLTSPQLAIKQFYRALASANHKRARLIGLHDDMDDFPRYQPNIIGLGKPTGQPRAFGPEHGFRSYWNELLRSHTAPYCIPHLSALKVTYLTPDVAVVNFRLRLTMNSSLWRFLVLFLTVLAVIVDMATRKVVTIEMQKVLVRVGEQWHVFSADWQGYEDVDHSWLTMS